MREFRFVSNCIASLYTIDRQMSSTIEFYDCSHYIMSPPPLNAHALMNHQYNCSYLDAGGLGEESLQVPVGCHVGVFGLSAGEADDHDRAFARPASMRSARFRGCDIVSREVR